MSLPPNVIVPNVIAIDGLSASGKGTLAKKLATHFGFAHLDTGKIYRLVALLALAENGALLSAPSATSEETILAAGRRVAALLDDPSLRDYQALLTRHHDQLAGDDVAQAASFVARNAALRTLLKESQIAFGRDPRKKGAVIDGRDIGTVIFPTAPIKFFVVASAEARATRRFLELQNLGIRASKDIILADLLQRDNMDRERPVAPLKMADDAVELDNTHLSIDEVVQRALSIIKDRKIFATS